MPRITPKQEIPSTAGGVSTTNAPTAQLMQQCWSVLLHALAVLKLRERWLYLSLMIGACVVFANLSQDHFVMITQTSAELCMFIFMLYYVATLAFVLSFGSLS